MNWRLTDPTSTAFEYEPTRAPQPKSRPPRTYQGTPRLQENGTYLCDSDSFTLIAYMVRVDEEGLSCTCPHWRFHYECKHIRAVAKLRADEKRRDMVTLESLFEQPTPAVERDAEGRWWCDCGTYARKFDCYHVAEARRRSK